MLFWLINALLAVFFFFFKYYGDSITSHLYHAQQFDLLNTLTANTENSPLAFYTGMMTDRLWGPLQSLCAGSVFLSISYIKLRSVKPIYFFISVLIYLIFTRPEVFFYPAYGEAITGQFSDAIWLVRHNMDYLGLLRQDTFSLGGPQVYPTSLYPLFLAFLIYVSPSSAVFLIVIHMCVFCMTAAIVTVFREILKPIFDDRIAALGAVLIISLPLFQSMVELINMELPCLFFSLFSVYYCINRRIGLASLTAVAALLVKAPGAVACATVLIAALLLLYAQLRGLTLPGRKGSNRLALIWASLACLAVILKGYARSRIIGDQTANNTVKLFAGWPNIERLVVFKIFVAVLVITLIYWIIRWIIKGKKEGAPFLPNHFPHLIIYAITSLWFILYLNFSVMGYRYQVLLVPFFWFAVIYATTILIKNQTLIRRLLLSGICFSFLCSHGLIYSDLIESSVYSYNHLERSLEYRNDLKIHMQMAKAIERDYSEYTIGAPWVSAHALAFPEAGYVNNKLDVMIYGYRASHGMKSFNGLGQLNIRKTIWVGFHKNTLNTPFPYPIDPQDKILREIQSGNKKIVLFMGGFAMEKVRMIEKMYLFKNNLTN